MIGCHRQPLERLAHGELRRLEDVDAVDGLDLDAADADGIGPIQDQLVERLAPRARQDLAVAEPLQAWPLGQDDGGGNHRAGQAAASDLVDAGHVAEAGQAQLALVPQVRVARATTAAGGRSGRGGAIAAEPQSPG